MDCALYGPRRRLSRGLTLFEMLVAIVIVAIMGAIGVPSLSSFLVRQQMNAQQEALLNSIAVARQTAQQTTQAIAICPSADGQTCSASAAWSSGWLVYQDTNGDGQLSSGESILLVHQYSGNRVKTLSANQQIRFLANGIVSTASLNLCSDELPEANKGLDINPVGNITRRESQNVQCSS